MISLYAACLRHLGLSQEDAGVVHARYGKAVRPDTIKSWGSGRVEPPVGALDDLKRYSVDMRRAVQHVADAAEALYLAENVSPGIAEDHGVPSGNAMIVAVAARYLAG